jgi:twitching motility protein PilT
MRGKIAEALLVARKMGAQDLIARVGRRTGIAVDGQYRALPGETRADFLEPDDFDFFIKSLPSSARLDMKRLDEIGYVSGRMHDSEFGPVRIQLYRNQYGLRAQYRLLMESVEDLYSLGHDEKIIDSLFNFADGLIVIAAPTGHGKTVTLTSSLLRLNYVTGQGQKIYMLERPREYELESLEDKVFFDQLEVPEDFSTFAQGLENAFRAYPQLIVITEALNRETMRAVVEAMATGHLVAITLHLGSAEEVVSRILSMFPGDEQGAVRGILAQKLRGIYVQRLVRRKAESIRDGGYGRVLATELLLGSDKIKDALEKGEARSIRQYINSNPDTAMHTLEQSLYKLWHAGEISAEKAREAAVAKDELDIPESAYSS